MCDCQTRWFGWSNQLVVGSGENWSILCLHCLCLGKTTKTCNGFHLKSRCCRVPLCEECASSSVAVVKGKVCQFGKCLYLLFRAVNTLNKMQWARAPSLTHRHESGTVLAEKAKKGISQNVANLFLYRYFSDKVLTPLPVPLAFVTQVSPWGFLSLTFLKKSPWVYSPYSTGKLVSTTVLAIRSLNLSNLTDGPVFAPDKYISYHRKK